MGKLKGFLCSVLTGHALVGGGPCRCGYLLGNLRERLEPYHFSTAPRASVIKPTGRVGSMKQFLCALFTNHQQRKAPDGSWPCWCRWARGDSHLRRAPAVPAQRTSSDQPASVA